LLLWTGKKLVGNCEFINNPGHKHGDKKMKFLVSVVKPIILQAAQSRQVKELVVQLMERYVKATDNDIDNVIFATVKAALLK